ncbi:YcxB family protein [Catellatospora tritici]|uniref:YcxB family protein n=1 Tax=Catellatospora tritici TaxID=2851566 RepID=UPI001C2DBE0D|nr:YcxB family protein [Catellatospora tritici]MBV1853943.1 YcxB family protein [Catellatospora tritici]
MPRDGSGGDTARMDDNEDGSVEVTVMWDRAEYRRLAWTAHRTRNRNNLIAAAVVLYVIADAFTWDKLSLKGVVLTYPAASFAVWLLLWLTCNWLWQAARTGHNWIEATPDWCYAPITVRVDAVGIHQISAADEALIRWHAITKVDQTSDFWIVSAPAAGSVWLPRRLISKERDVAIGAALARYRGQVGPARKG